MKKPVALVSVTAAAAIVATVAVVSVLQKPTPPPVGCQEMRVHMEQEFAMRLRAERRQMLKDAAAVVREGMKKQKAHDPAAAVPPEVEEIMHGLERRAAE